jgi:hypothetical protein
MRIGRTASCTDRLEILALSYQRDGGSLAEIFVGRSATRWLRL